MKLNPGLVYQKLPVDALIQATYSEEIPELIVFLKSLILKKTPGV